MYHLMQSGLPGAGQLTGDLICLGPDPPKSYQMAKLVINRRHQHMIKVTGMWLHQMLQGQTVRQAQADAMDV